MSLRMNWTNSEMILCKKYLHSTYLNWQNINISIGKRIKKAEWNKTKKNEKKTNSKSPREAKHCICFEKLPDCSRRMKLNKTKNVDGIN